MNTAESAPEASQVIHQIPITDLQPYPHQLRKHFDKDKLQQLANDIAVRGVRSAIEYFIDEEGQCTILAGERRFRAAKLASLETVPCVLRERTDFLEQLFDHASENLQRSDLNALELATFFNTLIEDGKIKPSDLPDELVKHGFQKYDRSYISNMMRLLKLPAWAKKLIQEDKLTAAHGKYLAPALASKPVTKQIQAFLKKQIPTTKKLKEAIEEAYEELHIDVCKGKHELDPEYGFRRLKSTKFNYKKECAECKTCQTIKSEYSTTLYCLDESCYDKKQADAIEKIAKSEIRKQKTAETKKQNALIKEAESLNISVEKLEEQKAAEATTNTPANNSRANARSERTQAYLDEYLRKQIDAHLIEDEATRYKVVLWMAAGAPGDGWGCITSAAGSVSLDLDTGMTNHGINITLQEKLSTTQLELMTCTAGINKMNRENLRILAHFIGIKLSDNYIIDRAYLDIKLKDDIIKDTPEAVIQSYDEGHWRKTCKKGAGFIKDQILLRNHLYGIPADLEEMYKQTGEDE